MADFRARKGVKCLVRRRGPRVLVRNVERASVAEIWEGDLSGWRIPGRRKARRRWCVVGGKRLLQCEEAVEMVDSSKSDRRINKISRSGLEQGRCW